MSKLKQQPQQEPEQQRPEPEPELTHNNDIENYLKNTLGIPDHLINEFLKIKI